MIGDVMLFARPPTPRPHELDLSSVVREVSAKFADEARAASIEVEIDAGAEVPIFADPVQLRIVVSSLFRNSFEALVSGGSVVIRTASVDDGGRRFAVLSISDDGPGLSESDREHLFDPFYSGRQAGRGLGFGLSKTWRIVTLHGGTIDVASLETGGVAFTVRWPGSSRPSDPLQPGES
jgi:hypothetical protein